MNHRHHPLAWAFDAGTWIGVRVRISVYFPLLVFVVCWKLGWQLGGVISAVLFLSVALHELGHVLCTRAVSGAGHDVLLWPFGGLAWMDDHLPAKSQMLVASSGPLVNLMICLLTLSAVIVPEPTWLAFNPLMSEIQQLGAGLASGESTRSVMSQVMQLVFTINWMLLLVNLVPAKPLDGGRILQSWLGTRVGPRAATDISPRFAFLAAAVLIVIGLVASHVFLMLLAFLLILINLHDASQQAPREGANEDSFLGYDFSEGYTSLERSTPEAPETQESPSEGSGSLFQRLHKKRESERQRQHQSLTEHEAEAVDQILAKLHETGMQSLTEAEKRLLKQASARYREKGRG
ncbi:MAG: site-2 protease family protein [Planctomycetales bacterium]|nr:site-2 protease family protein [Planctomycetales bacterium]